MRIAARLLPGRSPNVQPLARGQSSAAFTVEADGVAGTREQLVLRIAHGSLQERPESMMREAEVFRRLPAGIGPRLLAGPRPPERDAPVPPDAEPTSMLVTRVPGRVLPAARWAENDRLLVALAQQLADLHADADLDGLEDELESARAGDIFGAARTALDWWQEHEPRAAGGIETLAEAARVHFTRASGPLEAHETALLHGDPAAENILVEHSPSGLRVGLVDWEWWQVGDVARDLAFIGGPLAMEPYYAPLCTAQVDFFIAAYCARSAEHGIDHDPQRLAHRRLAHQLHEVLFTSAHLDRVAAGEVASADAAERRRAAERLARVRPQLRALLAVPEPR